MAIYGTCQDCGKETAGRGIRCRSCARKHDWTQSEYRDNHSVRMRMQWKQPGYNKRVSAKIKRTHNTPRYRARQKSMRNTLEFSAKIKGVMNSPEIKAKQSAGIVRSWRNPEHRRNRLEGLAKNLRRKASSLELIVKEFLDANFAGVIFQYVPDEPMPIGIFDFYIPLIDTIMEIDGYYWHSKEMRQERDLEKEEWALEHEYGFIRITEDQAKSSKYLISLLKELVYRG